MFTPSIIELEWILLAALLGISLLLPAKSRLLRAAKRGLSQIASRQTRAVVLVLGVVLIGRVALIPKLGIPRPGVMDEFGYLLTADTFAHGRLSNPTPPMWEHFESFHTIFQPTYQSQYPVGYPVVLAFAQVVFGNPWWGVLLTTAAMCGALVWMLQGWMPPFWSLMGGLLAAIRFGLFGYWVNSFWGGSLAALGGCLVFGAVPRLIPGLGRRNVYGRKQMINAIALGLGMGILLATRPFEGALICVPPAVVFLRRVVDRGGQEFRNVLTQVVLPATSILLSCGLFILYYQFKVTGHLWQSPLGVALKQIHVVQPFVFQTPHPEPRYRSIEFRALYAIFERKEFDLMHEPLGFIQTLVMRVIYYWKFFAGPLLTLPLIAVPLTVRLRKYRIMWISISLLAFGLVLESWIQDHYLAPAFCVYVLLLLTGIRVLRTVKLRRFRLGTRLVQPLPVICLLMLVIRVGAYGRESLEEGSWPPNWAFSTLHNEQRDSVVDRLNAIPGKSLVIVRYHYPFHNLHQDWIYNGADLTGAKILWARSMDAKHNCTFIQSYPDRKLWTVDEWGPSVSFSSATKEEICDPKNPIYEPNHPIDFYLRTLEVARRKRESHG